MDTYLDPNQTNITDISHNYPVQYSNGVVTNMEVPDTMDAGYWATSSPLSDFGDLDGSWSPSSGSAFSDSETSFQDASCAFDMSQTISQGEYQNINQVHCQGQGQTTEMISYMTLDPYTKCHESSFGAPISSTDTVKNIIIGENQNLHREFSIRGHLRQPVKKRRQRHAANQRERKRMRTINDAFEGLREKIPHICNNKKLSKVDTLKMAIRYIRHLADLIESCGEATPTLGSRQAQPVKVVIRSQARFSKGQNEVSTLTSDPEQEVDTDIYGHSLSWHDTREEIIGPDRKLRTRLWIPLLPTSCELMDLCSGLPYTS